MIPCTKVNLYKVKNCLDHRAWHLFWHRYRSSYDYFHDHHWIISYLNKITSFLSICVLCITERSYVFAKFCKLAKGFLRMLVCWSRRVSFRGTVCRIHSHDYIKVADRRVSFEAHINVRIRHEQPSTRTTNNCDSHITVGNRLGNMVINFFRRSHQYTSMLVQ